MFTAIQQRKKNAYHLLFLGLVSIFIFCESASALEHSVAINAQSVRGLVSMHITIDLPETCLEKISPTMTSLNRYLKAQSRESTASAQTAYALFQKDFAAVPETCQTSALEMTSIVSAIAVYRGQNSDAITPLVDLLAFVQRQHLIEPLTNDIRNSLGDIKNQNPMGAYSCDENQIWLDPTLRPYNMGTVLLHEVEHLFRNLALTSLSEKGTLPPSLFSNEDYHLFDESFSALNGGLKQVQLRSNLNRKKPKQVSRLRIPLKINRHGQFWWRKEVHYFQAKNDLDLYNPQGQLLQFWETQIRSEGIDPLENYETLLKQHFFVADSPNTSTERIFRLIESIYFPEIPMLGFDAFHIADQIINGPLPLLMPLVNPMEWAQTQDPKTLKNLIKTRRCDLNTSNNGGAEGVGLFLRKKGFRACLPPVKDL